MPRPVNHPLGYCIIFAGYLEELLCNNGNYSGMQLRDIQSERGQASRLSEQKCFLQKIFQSIFESFDLPELNCIALANEAPC